MRKALHMFANCRRFTPLSCENSKNSILLWQLPATVSSVYWHRIDMRQCCCCCHWFCFVLFIFTLLSSHFCCSILVSNSFDILTFFGESFKALKYHVTCQTCSVAPFTLKVLFLFARSEFHIKLFVRFGTSQTGSRHC